MRKIQRKVTTITRVFKREKVVKTHWLFSISLIFISEARITFIFKRNFFEQGLMKVLSGRPG